MKKLLEFLHWTPLGIVTVPIFIFSTREVYKKPLIWVLLNGVVLMVEFIIIFFLFGV